MSWIEQCACKRVLTTAQMKINGGSGKCDICQAVEHAESLKDRMNLNPDNKEEK